MLATVSEAIMVHIGLVVAQVESDSLIPVEILVVKEELNLLW